MIPSMAAIPFASMGSSGAPSLPRLVPQLLGGLFLYSRSSETGWGKGKERGGDGAYLLDDEDKHVAHLVFGEHVVAVLVEEMEGRCTKERNK